MLREPALREVKRGQELAAPLLELHRVEPLGRAQSGSGVSSPEGVMVGRL